MAVVAEEKFGSFIVHCRSVPAGIKRFWAEAPPAKTSIPIKLNPVALNSLMLSLLT
jgi:hypothetical protein